MTYYATHPQSYYGQGDVTAEFVGLARAAREKSLDDLPHIHFNGAGGNVAAGKYNDGSPEMRPVLTRRMSDSMRTAWEATQRVPVKAADAEWRVTKVALPLSEHFDVEELESMLTAKDTDAATRQWAARALAFLRRIRTGHQIELSCLRIKSVYLVHMPGELFVEYQLAAQAMRPNDTVCMAAYGDYGPFYIGTEIAYGQGGYETSSRSSFVAPQVEKVLSDGMRRLLK